MCSVQIYDKQLITGHSSVRTRATATIHYLVSLHIARSHASAKHYNISVLNDQGGKISAHMCSGEIFSSFSSQDRVPAPLKTANRAQSQLPALKDQGGKAFRSRMCSVQIFDKQLITVHSSVRTRATATVHYIVNLHIACSHATAKHNNTCVLNDQGGKISAHMCSGEIFSSFSSQDRVPAPLNAANRAQSQLPALKDQGGKAFRTRMCSVQIFDKQLITGHSSVRTRATATVHYLVNLHIACSHAAAKHYNTSVLNDQGGKISAHMCSGEMFSSFSSQDRVPAPLNAANKAQSQLPALKDQGGKAFRTRTCSVQIFDKQLITGHSSMRTRATATVHYIVNLHIACSHAAAKHYNTCVLNDQGGKISAHMCSGEIFSSFSSQDRVPPPPNAANRAQSQLPALKDQGGKAFRSRMCSVQIFDKQLITGHSSVRTRATATVHYLVNLHIACSHATAKHNNISVLNDQGGKISAHMCSEEIFSSFSSRDRVPPPPNAANRAQSQLPALKDQGGKAFRSRMCSAQIFDKQLITVHSSVRTRATATVHYLVNLHIACSHATAKHNNISVLNDQGGKISAHMCSGEIFSSFSSRDRVPPPPNAANRAQSQLPALKDQGGKAFRSRMCSVQIFDKQLITGHSSVRTRATATVHYLVNLHIACSHAAVKHYNTCVLNDQGGKISAHMCSGEIFSSFSSQDRVPAPLNAANRAQSQLPALKDQGGKAFRTRMCSVQIFEKQIITGHSSVRTRATATIHYLVSLHIACSHAAAKHYNTCVLNDQGGKISAHMCSGEIFSSFSSQDRVPAPLNAANRAQSQLPALKDQGGKAFRTRMCSVQIFDEQLITGHSSVRTRATATIHYLVNLHIACSHAAAKHYNISVLNDQGGKISAHMCSGEIFSSFSSRDRVPAPLKAANRAQSQLPALKDQGGKAFRSRMCSVQIFDKQLITGHSSVRTRATATIHYLVSLHIARSHASAKHYNISVLNDQGGKISAHMCSGEIFSSFSSQDRVPAPLKTANRAQSQLPALKDQGGKAFRSRMCSVQIFDKQLITGHSSVRTRATATVHYLVNLHIACSHASAKHNNTSVLNDQGGKISAHMCSGEIFSSFSSRDRVPAPPNAASRAQSQLPALKDQGGKVSAPECAQCKYSTNNSSLGTRL